MTKILGGAINKMFQKQLRIHFKQMKRKNWKM